MFRTLLYTSLLLTAFWPRLSLASSCVFGEVTDTAFSTAKHVFVFRVLATEIRESADTPLRTELGFGRLRLVENLRGNARYDSFLFSTGRGCGSKFVPGHYYLGISSSPENTFIAGPATVLDLGGEYREGIDNSQAFRTFSKLAAAAASGGPALSVMLPTKDRLPIEYFPVPPPPPTCGPEAP